LWQVHVANNTRVKLNAQYTRVKIFKACRRAGGAKDAMHAPVERTILQVAPGVAASCPMANFSALFAKHAGSTGRA
jgi:hypothetical protein